LSIDGLYISKKAKVRKPEYNKKKLVVIGHSYAEGCCASNIATNGTSKDSGLDRAQTDVINLKPDYVLSVYGYNVIGRISGDMTHQKYQDDYTKFIKMINDALPHTQIFASGISSVAGRTEESLKPYNDDIKNACANALNCMFIDLEGKINESNYNNKYIANDGIHPNDEGHKFLADEYAKVISSVIKK
jgi:lysophospholipase L1-like esterase